MLDGTDRLAPTCLNCGAIPAGTWCQDCGQKAGPAHRSVRHLVGELAELLTHADHRIWRTLRDLCLHPARLTNDFLAGKRASQVPPLRLFFVVLLLVFGIGSLAHHDLLSVHIPADEQPKIRHAIDAIHSNWPKFDAWLKPHLDRAIEQPDAVRAVMLDWLERFILLMLPIAAALLWLTTLSVRPRVSFFDHLVVSIHSLSVVGLVQVGLFLLGLVTSKAGLLPLVLPVHLFAHLRGVYGGGVVVTLLRMAVLAFGSVVALTALFTALAAIGLQFGAQ